MTDPAVFAEYASHYDESVQAVIGASGESVEYFARLKALLTRDIAGDRGVGHVLDFGCGIGNTTRCLATTFPSAVLTGFDLSRPSIDAARSLSAKRWPALRFVSSNGFGLPFESTRFDLAFASCVFHHIPAEEHIAWASEVHRVLRPGGAFVLFEHNPYNPLTRRVVRDCPFDKGVRLLRPRYAQRVLQAAGFRDGQARYYFFFPRVLRWLRPMERMLRWLPAGGQYFSTGWKV
jgi:SAM-dependent methyltransferase